MAKALLAMLASLLLSAGVIAQTGYAVTAGQSQTLCNQPAQDSNVSITNSATSSTCRLKVTVWVWTQEGDQTEPQWNPKSGYPDYVNKGGSGVFGCGSDEKLTIEPEDSAQGNQCIGTYTVT